MSDRDERVLATYLRLVRILRFDFTSQPFHLLDACCQPPALLNLFLLVVEPEPVLFESGISAGRGGRPQVILIERHGQRRVRWQDQLRVPLAPVSAMIVLDSCST